MTSHDLSDESKLKESEQRYRALSDAAFEAIFISENGICTDTNEAAVKMFGYNREELIGIFGADVIAPESRERVRSNMMSGYEEPYEAVAQKKDGTRFYAEFCGKMIQYMGKQVRVTVVNNIDKQKRALLALEQSEQKYRQLVNSLTDHVWIMDLETKRYSYSSPSVKNILGYTQEEFTQMRSGRTLTEESREFVRQTLKEELKRNEIKDPARSRTIELSCIHKEGHLVWIEIIATFLRDKSGNPTGILGVTRDITDRKNTEQLLKKSHEELERRVMERTVKLINTNRKLIHEIEERKRLFEKLARSERMATTGHLASSVAHEINSPLQGVTSLLDVIKKTNQENEELIGNINLVKSAFNSIRDTVKNLLDLNRPSANIKQRACINRIIRQTCTLLGSYLKRHKIRLVLDLYEDLPESLISQQQMSQCFINMINNSVDAINGFSDEEEIVCGPGGEIRITTGFESRAITVEIADTGAGIPETDHEMIFDPFYTRNKEMGMGVGLAICNSIIKKHEGKLSVRNRREGGCVFTMTFPVEAEAVTSKTNEKTTPSCLPMT